MSSQDLTQNWGQKQFHELKFGIYTSVDDRKIIKTRELGGSYARLAEQKLKNIPPNTDHLLIFGNHWANKTESTVFHNPMALRHIEKREFLFWDNPALPHLLYKGPWNPHGYKNWCRLNWNWINSTPYTKPANPVGSSRINHQLKTVTKGSVTDWRTLTGGVKSTKLGKTALLLPSSPDWHRYYQETTVQRWTQEKTELLESRGYTVKLRTKPSRRDREGSVGKLYEQLDGVGLVVTEGVSSIEAILAGVPALVGDWAPTGDLATHWEDFVLDEPIRTPTADQTEQWMERILQDTFHKTELYSGEWHVRTT